MFSDCSLGSSFPFSGYVNDTIFVVVDDSLNLTQPPPGYRNRFACPVPKTGGQMCPGLAQEPYYLSVWLLVYRFWTTPGDSRRIFILELRDLFS